MGFWLFFYGYITCIALATYFTPYMQRKFLFILLLFSIWGVASFRYMVGTDYPMYMSWVYGLPIDSIEDIFSGWTEPIPALIIYLIKSFNFASQMFFVVTETIILVFTYIGCNLYLKDITNKILFFSLYVVMMLQGLYFWSMNGIRQSMALSLGFIALYFFITGSKWKFIALTIVACFFHSSAIFLFIGIFFCKLHFSFKVKIFVLVCSSILCISGVSGKIITFSLKNAYLYGSKYGDILSSIDLVAVPKIGIAPVLFSLFIIALYYAKKKQLAKKYEKYNFLKIEDIAFGYIVMRLFTNFSFMGYDASVASLLETLIHRVEVYFVLLYIVYIVYIIYDFGKGKDIIVRLFLSLSMVIMFSVESLMVINLMLSDPVGAAHYQINFDLFR